MKVFIPMIAASALLASGWSAQTAPQVVANGILQVKIEITKACKVTSSGDNTIIDFGKAAFGYNAVKQESTIKVMCSPGATYYVGLSAGENTVGDISKRGMKLAGNPESEIIPYQLYRDPEYKKIWGLDRSDCLSGTGTGAEDSIKVYATLPETTKIYAPGAYTDTVKMEISF